MSFAARAPAVSQELLAHYFPAHVVLRNSCKISRPVFQSIHTVHLQYYSTARDGPDILGRQTASKIDEAYVPFHGTATDANVPQHVQHDLQWKYISGVGRSDIQIERYHHSVAQSQGKQDALLSTPFQSCYLDPNGGSHNRLQDSSMPPKFPNPKMCPEDAFSPRKKAKAMVDIGSARKGLDDSCGTESCGADSRDDFLVSQEGISIHRSKSDFSGACERERYKSSRKLSRPSWQVQKEALTQKFSSVGWSPRKRLSPDALEGIRSLHSQYPDKYTTPVLADHFQVSPEAIRRILKSKWRPSEEEEIGRRDRWDKRGEAIWRQMVEMGIKPPKKWREMGLRKGKTQSVDVGVGADGKPSIREHLLGALKYRQGTEGSVVAGKQEHVVIPPAPLSQRIL